MNWLFISSTLHTVTSARRFAHLTHLGPTLIMTCSYRLRLISVYAGTILAGCLMVAADRTLNIINSCPSSITVYVNGESAGSLATGATVTKSVADDWSGFIYSNVNAPEGNTGAGTTKAGFVNQAGYYFIVKDTSNFNTGVSIVPSTSSSNGLCKRLTCHSKFCANSMTKQPTELPAPSNSSAPEPPLFSCALTQSFDVRFCPSNAFPRTGDTVTLHPGGSSNKCVNARGTAANGTVVDILDCDGSASQRWILNPGDTRAELAGTGYCLDAGSGAQFR
ncbi:hypothetical protein D9611_001229 [Ephemerocybe angulata]|uniref:Ricin B lectin domain-containing protein n=1 Tax=Ephemerocybe angulata TaxID=980116 RepID=A0A8H5FMQ7_9AGAR|nr:hypothetical protein D9611_001229 [Tulosesus angulatus]